MKSAAKNNKLNIIVILLFAGSVLLRSVIGDFPKALRIYPDELRYVSIARSLFQGQGLQIHHLDTDFQKILYSICIMPAFLAKTSALQIRLIGYINSVIISSSVFPVYALCRKMLLDRRETYIILTFWTILPTLLDSIYFMSEVVYLPLALWLIYCVWCTWHSESLKERICWNLLLGLLCYLAYLCKEIALYFVLAYFVTTAVRLLVQRSSWKREWIGAAVFGVVFLISFLIMKRTLFYGMQNSYSSFNLTGVRGLALLQHPEKIGYLLYAFLYDTLYAVIALGVFPVLIPIACFDKNKKESWFDLFVLTAFLIGCATIAYTITLPEEFGKRSPRQHLRYLEPFVFPLYIRMLCHLRQPVSDGANNSEYRVCCTDKAAQNNIMPRVRLWKTMIYWFSAAFILVGAGGGSCLVDNTMLVYYEFFVRFIGKADWMAFAVRTLMAAALFFGTQLLLKDRQRFIRLFAALFLSINLINSTAGYAASIYRYAITKEQRAQASQADQYLQNIEGTILLISDSGWESEDSRLFDTYINRDFYVTELNLLQDTVIDLSTDKIPCYFPYESYQELTKVDYLIVKEDYGIAFEEGTVEELTGFPMRGYRLYRNQDGGRIRLERV